MKNGFDVFASLLSATPDDSGNLAAWLAEREAKKDVMNMNVDLAVQDNERLALESVGYDKNIAISQIRILSKRYTADPDIVPYIAVLEKWEDNMWLIVPFSPYKTPATEGEMSTGLNVYGLRVIQAWNGRTVQDKILMNSYLFGELEEKVRNEALALFRHEFGGVALPADFSAQRGGPIVEASDPRRDYIDECIGRFQPLSDAVFEMAESSSSSEESGGTNVNPSNGVMEIRVNYLFNKYLPEGSEYALAAATEDITPRVPVLMCRESWDAMIDSREVSGFSGFYPGDESCVLTFDLCDGVPNELDVQDGMLVLAYKRSTRQQIGTGRFRCCADGGYKISVKLVRESADLEVQDASEIVLVVEE